MDTITVLGKGCIKCVKTAEAIQEMAHETGVQVEVVKDTSPEMLLQYRVMSTPAVVINGTLVHSGSVPGKDVVRGWLDLIKS
jgi:predicted thioredoxin/glutaredoxin